jgi:hypothetical protein
MKKLAAVVLALAAGSGCYAQGYGSTGYAGGGTYVAYSQPVPEYSDVNVYYEERPGYVYVSGRYNWVNNNWAWQNGYYEAERPNHVYVQGYWQGNRWFDGRWEPQRQGYVHTNGYWDRRGNGHVWVGGGWERDRGRDHTYVRGSWSNNNGVRSYNRGGWQPRARSGPVIRDHR